MLHKMCLKMLPCNDMLVAWLLIHEKVDLENMDIRGLPLFKNLNKAIIFNKPSKNKVKKLCEEKGKKMVA